DDDIGSTPELVGLRDRTEVAFEADWPETRAEVSLTLTDGRTVTADHDSGVPAADVAEQGARIRAKFLALTTPILGDDQSRRLADAIEGIEDAASLDRILDLTRRQS
ncbi:MAG: hypothetical protein AAF942_15085, partial [Pseudomonadota bacterium]